VGDICLCTLSDLGFTLVSWAVRQAAADQLAARGALPPPQTLAMLAGAEVLRQAAPLSKPMAAVRNYGQCGESRISLYYCQEHLLVCFNSSRKNLKM